MHRQNIQKQLFVPITVFLIFFLLGLFYLVSMGNYNFSIYFNTLNHNIADLLFKYLTYLGDGIFAFIVAIVCFFYRRDYGLIMLISLLITTLITQFLKRIIFIEKFRPSNIFSDLIESGKWHLVEGVHLHDKISFPSGHAATVFCVGILLCIYINSKRWSIFILTLVSIVGLSRVYLSQHFLEDILMGSMLGTIVSILVYYFFSPFLLKYNK